MIRSTPEFDQRVADWLEADPTAAPADVLSTVVAALPSIPQARRGLLAPRRFTLMNGNFRIAASAIVAVLAVGGALYLLVPGGGFGGPKTTPTPTVAPPTATPAPSQVAPGITAWTTYTSEVHGFTLGYPEDWSVNAPATRKWQTGDELRGDPWPYADTFVSPGEGDASIGLFVWEVPRGEGTDWFTVEGLKAWAEKFCVDVGASACDEFTQGALPMCVALVIDPDVVECDAALLVPTAEAQYAFFADRGSLLLGNDPRVTVVVVAREDGFPSAARYGGSVELLKAILTTMDVWTPGQVPIPYPG